MTSLFRDRFIPLLVVVLLLIAPRGGRAAAPGETETETETETEAETETETPSRVGYGRTGFFIQSKDGRFRFRPTVRLQVQAYQFFPKFNPPDTRRDSLFVRRARPEFYGVLFDGRVQFKVVAEAAFLINGRSPSADEYLRFDIHEAFKIQVGQFSVPFSLENRTAEPFLPFLERSLVARNLGPAIKEPGAMAFGSLGHGVFHYQVGVFNGGEINTRNVDNHFDAAGRVFVRPLAPRGGPLEKLQVGGSGTWGRRVETNAPYLGGMIPTAQGWLGTAFGHRFFPVVYDASDQERTRVGVVPEGQMWRAAAELSVPIDRFELRSEYLHLQSDIDENVLALGTPVRRGGTLRADGGYAEIGIWLLGGRDAFPDPGMVPKTLVDATDQNPPRDWHLQVLVRSNYVDARYRAGPTVFLGPLGPSRAAGRYRLADAQVGLNLWWTRHLRFTFNYNYTRLLEGRYAVIPAPGQNFLHELSVRAQVYL